MAWTAPRTWADGDIVTPEMLNTDIRDNLLTVSQHAHDGTAGDGADDLSGVDTITLDDIADPSAPGASKTVVWAESGKLKQRAGASGAVETFDVSGHNHAVSADVAGAETSESAGDSVQHQESIPINTTSGFLLDISQKTMASRSVTFGGDALAFASAVLIGEYNQSGGIGISSIAFRLRIDGTIQESVTDSDPSDGHQYRLFFSGEKQVAAGATTVLCEFVTLGGTDPSDWVTFWIRMYSGSAIYT